MGIFVKTNKLRAGDTGRDRFTIGRACRRPGYAWTLRHRETTVGRNFRIERNQNAEQMEALLNPEIKALFLNTGGGDGIRLLPYIDFDIIKNNPKVFIGFSDGDTFHHMFTHAGVTSFYGASVLATIAEPIRLNPYTEKWIKKALFSDEPPGLIEPCEKRVPIDWNSTKEEELIWTKNDGYKVYQGSGKVRGHIMVSCGGPLRLMMGTRIMPGAELWKDSIICLEAGATYDLKLARVHDMRSFVAAGMFKHADALVLPNVPDDVVEEVILKVLKEEGLNDLLVFAGVEFSHTNPLTVLPIGVEAEIDCDNRTFAILESGVM